MNVTIINGEFAVSDEERVTIEKRLLLALSRYTSRIASVTVKLSGTEHQTDEHRICRIEVFLRPMRSLVVEDSGIDLQAAVDRAATQMARSVERKLRRDREK